MPKFNPKSTSYPTAAALEELNILDPYWRGVLWRMSGIIGDELWGRTPRDDVSRLWDELVLEFGEGHSAYMLKLIGTNLLRAVIWAKGAALVDALKLKDDAKAAALDLVKLDISLHVEMIPLNTHAARWTYLGTAAQRLMGHRKFDSLCADMRDVVVNGLSDFDLLRARKRMVSYAGA